VSEPRGTLAIVAGHLAQAIAPLDRILRDPATFTTTMAQLGWSASAPPASYAAIADATGAAVAAAEALVDDAELADVLAVIEAVGEVYTALDGLNVAPAGVDANAFLPVIGRDLFEYLLADHLAAELPGLFWPLKALGVVSSTALDPAGGRPGYVRTRFAWEELPAALADPAAVPASAFGWGSAAFDFSPLAEIATGLLTGIGIGTSVDRVDPALGDAVQAQATGTPKGSVFLGFTLSLFDSPDDAPLPVGLSVTELPAEGTAPPGVLVLPLLPPSLPAEYDAGGGWTFGVRAGSDLSEQLGLVVRPGETAVRYPFAPGRPFPEDGLGASLTSHFDPPLVLLGEPGGTRLELASLTWSLDVDADAEGLELTLGAAFGGLAFVLSAGSLDSFLGSVLGSSEVRVDVPFALSWSSRTGVGLASDVGFTLTLRPEIAVGGVRMDRVDLALALTTGAEPELALRALAALSGTFGPVSFAADGLGAELPVRFSSGNAGPFDVSFAFVLPTGVGIGVDAGGVVTGGAFLDVDAAAGRYAGIGEINILGVGLIATGVITTSGPAGFSMFISLAAEFAGIPLGFGFTLNGVGGLVGIDRGLDEDALGEAARTGSLDAVLFPENAIADAALILAAVDAIFPPADGQSVFGPMVKIGWGMPTLVEIDAAVAIQLPEPLTVSLLGALHAVLPEPDVPILELHVNFAGTVNLTEGTLKIDASLTGSQVAGLLITGDMAVRAAFLDAPEFLLAFGGFHPAFDPPEDFPELDKVGVSLDTGDALRISLGGYFAVTSNSIQTGARAELWAGAEGFTVEGGTSFNAILTWDPFSFAIGLRVWISVTAAGAELMGVLLAGRLSGPNPWKVFGKAEFRLLGVKVGFEIDEDFGELANEGPPDEADVAQLIRAVFETDDAWSALPPIGPDPVVVADAAAGELALHPSGRVQALQRLAPLDVELECYGTADILGETLLSVKADGFAAADVEDAQDWFAGAQYFALSEDEQLSAPSFELMKAGVIMGGSGADAPAPATAVFDHEIAYRDPVGRRNRPDPTHTVSARDAALTRALGPVAATPERYGVAEARWILADPSSGASTGGTPATGLGFFAARSRQSTRAAVLTPTYEAELIG
jgi:hypothetical protein